MKRQHSAGEQLPVNQYPAITVSFWAALPVLLDGLAAVFGSEHHADNNPLFNLSTASTV
ncbi:MAG: hypothetical protein U1G07_24730 [Verrucomicrobiota bacterium]